MLHSFPVPISVVQCVKNRHILFGSTINNVRTALQSQTDITFASVYDWYHDRVSLVAIEPVLVETFALDFTRAFSTSRIFSTIYPVYFNCCTSGKMPFFAARDTRFVHQSDPVLPHCIPLVCHLDIDNLKNPALYAQ